MSQARDAGAPRRRLLVVSGLYPTTDRPTAGVFVQQRVRRLRADGAEVRVVAARSYTGSVILRYLMLAARTLLGARKVDAIEAHVLVPTGSIAVAVAAVWRLPVVVVAHGSDVLYTPWRHRFLERLARWTIGAADAVVANSAATAVAVRTLGGDPVMIAPGVDLARFTPGRSERARLGLPEKRVALFVGPSERHKGSDIFVEGLRLAGWQGVVIGQGHPTGGDTAHVTLLGPLDQQTLTRYFRSVDCVAVTSRREGLGLVAIEAAACGTPIVASPVGGLPEIVVDGVNGALMARASPDAFAEALTRLETMQLDREAIRASVARYGLDEATERMADLWAAVTAASTSDRRG